MGRLLRLLALGALAGTSSGAGSAEKAGNDPVVERLAALEAEFSRFEQASARKLQDVEIERAMLQDRIQQLEGVEHRRLNCGGNCHTDATTANIADLQSAADHIWLLLCGALVMFMQTGFAMVEAGCCRAKNVQNILMKNIVDVCVGTICWWISGWTLAYGKAHGENHAFANDWQPVGRDFTQATDEGIFKTEKNYMLNWFFQWAFCSAAATIISGGVAERMNFPAYLLVSAVMTSWVYPVVVHWTWGYGWLSGGDDYQINPTGFMDFAGSGIVHLCGGTGALVAAVVVGPRTGRFDGVESFDPHSLPLIVLGTFILWFGWYGFNCGSTLSMHTEAKATLAAQVAMNTTLSGATGGLVVLAIRFLIERKYDVGAFCNGILVGLVSITAGCANVECGTAVLIGTIGAFLYLGASMLVKKLRVDDPVDAFAVHGVSGAWGVLAAAFFDWGTGADYFNGWSGWVCVGWNGSSGSCRSGAWDEAMVANVVEIVVIAAWTAGHILAVCVPLRLLGLLRADDETQAQGMDAKKHSPSKGYAIGSHPPKADHEVTL